MWPMKTSAGATAEGVVEASNGGSRAIGTCDNDRGGEERGGETLTLGGTSNQSNLTR